MQKRIVVFKRKNPTDIGDKLLDADIIQVNHDRFTVTEVKREGDKYASVLCFNSKRFALVECSEKEPCTVTPMNIQHEALKKSIELNLEKFFVLASGVKLKLSLQWIADTLVMTKVRDFAL